MRTFSNGGLVAGRDGVLAVEGFASEEGSGWLAEEARRLTGRRPIARRADALPRRPLRRPRRLPRRGCAGGDPRHRGHARPAPPTAAGGGPPDHARPRTRPDRARPGRPAGPDRSARGPHPERPDDRGARPARRLVRRPGLERPLPQLRGRHAQPADGARAAAARGAGHALGPGSRLGGAGSRAARVSHAAREHRGRGAQGHRPRCAGRRRRARLAAAGASSASGYGSPTTTTRSRFAPGKRSCGHDWSVSHRWNRRPACRRRAERTRGPGHPRGA